MKAYIADNIIEKIGINRVYSYFKSLTDIFFDKVALFMVFELPNYKFTLNSIV